MVSQLVPRILCLWPQALGFQASHLAYLVFHLGSKKPNSYPHACMTRTLPAEPSACPGLGCLGSKLDRTLPASFLEAVAHLFFPDPWFYGTVWWDSLRLLTHRPCTGSHGSHCPPKELTICSWHFLAFLPSGTG